MLIDLSLGAIDDVYFADKYRAMGPKFKELLTDSWRKMVRAGDIAEFSEQYFADRDIAYLVKFIMNKLDANMSYLESYYFKVCDDAKVEELGESVCAVMGYRIMEQFVEQNPKLKAAIAERKSFNNLLSMLDLPANVDFAREDILRARLRRKESQLKQKPDDAKIQAAYAESCKKLEACMRYKGLVAANVIKPIKIR